MNQVATKSSPIYQVPQIVSRLVKWGVALLGILLLLAALLLPAVQQARESSRSLVEGLPAEKFALMDSPAAVSSLFASAPAAREAEAGKVVGEPVDPHRKIIYSAQVNLAVEDFAGIAEKVTALVKEFDGYVAGSNLSGTSGETRGGTWKIRVPVARFDEFVAAAKRLGEVVSAGTSSKDVSEEYYDIDARIRNKTKEEERLLKLLEDRPGKLEDVIAIERELSRVREELERMQGRMRVLSDLTSLTTVDVSISEIKNYQPEEAPTLATRIRRSFDGSLSVLQSTGANTLVLAAGLIPWLPLFAIAVALCWIIVRRQRRRLPSGC